MLAGGLLLAAVAAYLWLACTRHEPLRFRRFEIPVPKPRVAFAQLGVACADLLCAASVLYVLLPQHAALSFGAFAGIYLIAIAAGVISNVPGGIGVFEAVLLLLLRSVPEVRLLGALVAYRAIYYFVPFVAALALLGAHEVWVHRGPAVRLARLLRAFLTAVTPQAIAIATFLAGAVLLFSGATPGLGNRLDMLRDFVPLPILELSHLLGSAVGVGLLVIAHGLYRRLDAAWWLTIWLLCAGILLSLLKGFDYEEATILAAVVVVLVSARGRFQRRASLIEQHYSGPWIIALCLVLLTAAWLVIFAYRHVPYDNQLWWEFAFHASAPRSLRASLLAAVIAAAYGLWRLLRPAPPPSSVPGAADMERAAALIAQGDDTVANLALLGDKNFMFNAERTAFIMYQVSGNSWVAMGDPVGPPEARESLAWEFLETLRRDGGLAGVLSGEAGKSALVRRSGIDSRASWAKRHAYRSTHFPWRAPRAPTCARPTGARTATARLSRSLRAPSWPCICRSCVPFPTPGSRKRRQPRSVSLWGFSMNDTWRTSTAEWCAVAAPSSHSPIYGAAARTNYRWI